MFTLYNSFQNIIILLVAYDDFKYDTALQMGDHSTFVLSGYYF